MNKKSTGSTLAGVEVFVGAPDCTINFPLVKLELNCSNCMSALKKACYVIFFAGLNYPRYVIELASHIIHCTE
jgi:hypothetical protein